MSCDVIVVGGGLSGLMAGITAARKGRKVLLLEKHTTVGGHAAGFRRKGYYFDSGMSRFMGASVRGFLKELGLLEKVAPRPVRAIWNIEGHWIDYSGLSRFFRGLAELFPEEKNGLLSLYESAVNPIEKPFAVLFADTSTWKTVPRIAHMLRLAVSFPAIARSMSSKETEGDVLGRYLDRKGKAYTFLAEREDEVDYRGEMTFATKVGKWYTQMFNVYPAGGFQALADAMAAQFKDLGGEIRTSAAVSKIIIANGRASGVVVGKDDGERMVSDNVICCVDLNKAFRDLVGPEFIGPELMTRLDRSKLSFPIPILYLGLSIRPPRLKELFQGHDEVFFYPAIETGKEEAGFYRDHPMVIHSSCFHCPEHAPAGKSNVQVYLSGAREGWMDSWGIKDGRRTEAYRDLKRVIIEQVLLALERVVPDLKDRSRIEVCELGTPFTIERYTGNTGGSALGYRMDEDYINPRKFGKYLERCEAIENLFFAGQQTGYPGGVGNALGSGKRVGKLV
jgi:phytoene dehydrogenase-like protein